MTTKLESILKDEKLENLLPFFESNGVGDRNFKYLTKRNLRTLGINQSDYICDMLIDKFQKSVEISMSPIQMIEVLGGKMPKDSEASGEEVKSFNIGVYTIMYDEWEVVRNWGVANGFDIRIGASGGLSPFPWENGLCVGESLGSRHPVTEISWYDAIKWCNAKSLMDGVDPVYWIKDGSSFFSKGEMDDKPKDDLLFKLDANGYRLPTDTEWEWAARGGIYSKGYIFAGSNILSEVGWYAGNSGGGVHASGKKMANELELYDMCGNVEEFVWGIPDLRQTMRISTCRGGSWNCYEDECTVNSRGFGNKKYFASTVGFRVAQNI